MKTIRLTEDGTAELQVTHMNGETRWLVIEAWGERWISVRWPMAGQYDVMLKDGRMVARSAATKRKNPLPNPWTANVQDCREYVAEKLGLSKEENEERYKVHHESMPQPARAESQQPRSSPNRASGE